MALPRLTRRRFAVLLALGVGASALLFPGPAARAAELPLLALSSVGRMVAAYLLSLIFAIAFGHAAATNKRASTVLLPFLDVLQSVPIFGFFPAALVFFVGTFRGHPAGLELAVVFLIFTSMAWNMAYGVYESLITVPRDLEVAADSFSLKGWLRFRRLLFPAMIPKLVYNSMLSWSNGWYFLVASEVFTAFGETHTRPGLGAFIAQAGIAGDAGAIALGLAALAAVVLSLDAVFWRPLSVWSERFRIESTSREALHAPGPYERLRWLPRFPGLRKRVAVRTRPLLQAWERTSLRLEKGYSSHPEVVHTIQRVDLAMFLAVFGIVTVAGIAGLVALFARGLPPGAAGIPAAALNSFLRLGFAYVLALAWTVPMAAWVGRDARAARFMTPALEVFASLPATALLPAILAFSILVASWFGRENELAALLIGLFAMQWYLLFNLIAGVRSISGDILEAAKVFGLRGRTYLRRVLLPAIAPSLVTGSVTAWGAGWNATIVSEYIPYGGRTYEVGGLGNLLARATFGAPPDTEMVLLTVLTMIVVVLAMNKLVWRPLYHRVSVNYRMEVQ